MIENAVMASRLVAGSASSGPLPSADACRPGGSGVVPRLVCGDAPARWPELVVGWLGHAWLALVAVALGGLVAVGTGLVMARRRRLVAARAACWVEVLPPSRPRAAGGPEFWRLVGVVQRRVAGRWGLGRRRAVVGVELLADRGRVRIGLWLPAGVPVGAVRGALGSAWPGAQLRSGPVPLPPTGGRLAALRGRPDKADALPVFDAAPRRLRPDASLVAEEDPLHAVMTGLVQAAASGQWAVVQVLARPARRRRVRVAAAQARPGGRRPSGWRRLVLDALDLLTPGLATGTGGAAPAGRTADPLAAERARAVAQKATAGPHWEVALTVAVAAPSREAAEARAAQIGGGLALFSDAATVGCRRLRLARRPVASRMPRAAGWWLACLPEMAALAHLPYAPAQAGIRAATGRQVPPPPQLYLTETDNLTDIANDDDGGSTFDVGAA